MSLGCRINKAHVKNRFNILNVGLSTVERMRTLNHSIIKTHWSICQVLASAASTVLKAILAYSLGKRSGMEILKSKRTAAAIYLQLKLYKYSCSLIFSYENAVAVICCFRVY